MKKSLLSLGFAAIAFGASAQINDAKDGYYADFTDATSYCTINAAALPNNGGVMNGDGSGNGSTFTGDNKLTSEGLVLVSNTDSAYVGTGREQYFQIPVTTDNDTPDDDTDDKCSKASKEYGVNVANDNSVFYITVSSDVDSATLQLFLGGEGEWGPATNSGLNEDGNGIVASVTVNSTPSTYAVDFVDPAFNPSDELTADSVWSAWVGKNNINSFGFRSATEGATFTITEIAFGTEEIINSLEKEAGTYGFEAYPNPSSNVINFIYTVNGTATIELSNTLGSAVVSTEGTSVDVSELSSGIYFATLKVNGVSKAIQRVQVQ